MKKSIIALLGLAAIGFSAECLATETVYNIAHFMRENGCGNPANPIIDTYHEHEVQVYNEWNPTDPNSTSNPMHGHFQTDGRVSYFEGATTTATGSAIPLVEYSRWGNDIQTTDMSLPLTADTLSVHPTTASAATIGFKTMKGGTYRMRFRVKRLATSWRGDSKSGTGSQVYANDQSTPLGNRVVTTADFAWSAWEESANQNLAAGESIYFKLDANGDQNADYTLVELEVIATNETPSPSPVLSPVTIDLTKMVDDYMAAHSGSFAATFDISSRFTFSAGYASKSDTPAWVGLFEVCGVTPFSSTTDLLLGWRASLGSVPCATANISSGGAPGGSRDCLAGEMAVHPQDNYSPVLRFEAKQAVSAANGDLELTFRDLNDYNNGCSHGVYVQTLLNGVSLDKRWCCNRATNDVAKIRFTSDLAAGDKFDIVVHRTDTTSCDATAIGLKLILPAGDKGILYIK